MSRALQWTGLGKVVSFYRYFAFDLPRSVSGTGAVLLAGVGAIRLYVLLVSSGLPTYLVAYFVALLAATVLGGVAILAPRRAVARAGWACGSIVAAVSVAVYVASRTVGLPGLPQLIGRWDFALGTFSLVLAALYLGLHLSVLTGVNVAWPDRRHWLD